jgi:membrane-associated protease RseP (regulator of RpoE activity)
MDVLQEYVLRLDFDLGRLQVYPALDSIPEGWGASMPLTIEGGFAPLVTVQFGKNAIEHCVIATGANISTLAPGAAEALHAAEEFQLFQGNTSSATPAGFAPGRSGRMPYLTIASYQTGPIRFDIASGSSLGLNAMSRFNWTLNFPGKSACISPSRHLETLDQPATSGLAIIWERSKPRVFDVQPGSPAADAGFQAGDILSRIGDLEVTRFDGFALGRVLTSRPGSLLKIQVVRNDKPVDLSLKLAERPLVP